MQTSRLPGFLRRIVQFFTDAWLELKKVAWPTRVEAWRFTLVVLFAVVVMAIFIHSCDWLLTLLSRPLFAQ